MTERQKKIIEVALQLFAEEGFQGTSTNRIAKEAKVSEGLIFRHFKNKEGLLMAILAQGRERLASYFSDLTQLSAPQEILKRIISVPFEIEEIEYPFWRLLYTLKWQQRYYDGDTMNEVFLLAEKSVEEMGFPDPKVEVEVLKMILDGAATLLLLQESKIDRIQLKNKILDKYNLK